MPTTYGSLYPKIYDFNNLLDAYKSASEGKRYCNEALLYKYRLEENLINLQNHLVWHSWEPKPFRYFTVREPKKREIAAPAFADRVLHHAVVNVIEPLFERKFLSCSFACRKGKGTYAAVNMAQKYIESVAARHKRPYIFKGDIKSYFASIPHWFIKNQYRRVIRCPETLWLVDRIVDTGSPNGVGLPIGALTSQLLANVNLDALDHFAKEHLGIKYYLRYMDDFIAICANKNDAQNAFWDLQIYAECDMGLTLNHKSRIFPLNRGLNFCGYRIWYDHRLPRKRNVRRMRRRMKKLCAIYRSGGIASDNVRSAWASFLGYMKHCEGHKTTLLIWKELIDILRRDKLHDLDA